ncbi:MAG: outer membrane protein assembly factor BamD [Arcobacteraceae bacterium]
MHKKILTLLFAISLAYIFTGCSSKTEEEYNKPAVYWYNKMINQISNYQLDQADNTFTSLESEHRNSPLLPSAMMIIATTHMEDEAYAMANYYFDEYLKRYSLKKDADYIRYLKIKSNFLAFKNQFREQDLLTKTIQETDTFVKEYPYSQYIYLVKNIKSRLLMSRSVFDTEISELYGRIDKPQAEKYYADKASNHWENTKNIDYVDVPWYRAIFE